MKIKYFYDLPVDWRAYLMDPRNFHFRVSFAQIIPHFSCTRAGETDARQSETGKKDEIEREREREKERWSVVKVILLAFIQLHVDRYGRYGNLHDSPVHVRDISSDDPAKIDFSLFLYRSASGSSDQI